MYNVPVYTDGTIGILLFTGRVYPTLEHVLFSVWCLTIFVFGRMKKTFGLNAV